MKAFGVMLGACAVLALSGCASTRSPDTAQKDAAVERHCLRETGTRAARGADYCGGPGRVYTREDLDRTGGLTVRDALGRLGH